MNYFIATSILVSLIVGSLADREYSGKKSENPIFPELKKLRREIAERFGRVEKEQYLVKEELANLKNILRQWKKVLDNQQIAPTHYLQASKCGVGHWLDSLPKTGKRSPIVKLPDELQFGRCVEHYDKVKNATGIWNLID